MVKSRLAMNFRPYVERLFREAPDRTYSIRRNPVTGSQWMRGADPIKPQKDIACRALVARARFAWDNPGLPPLPLSYEEREDMKRGGLPHIIAWYARSLADRYYRDLAGHVSFTPYAWGVMASPYAPDFIK
jgi:hypothetical protein